MDKHLKLFLKCPHRNCKEVNKNRAWIIYENKKDSAIWFQIKNRLKDLFWFLTMSFPSYLSFNDL